MTDYNVKINHQQSFKVTTLIGGVQVPAKLQDLLDVDITETDKKNKYVLMYDSTTGEYKLVNPDEVLSAASNTETTQPGLPGDFVNTLDVDLDNKIDLDAGTF
jgi:hypothetical protein